MTFVILTSLISDSYSQIIHKNDLEYFIGCFPLIDTLDSFDYTEFTEWYIIKPDSGGRRRDFGKIKYSNVKHWVYNSNKISKELGVLKYNRYLKEWRGLNFYIMMEFGGHENQRNVLTVWKPVGRDSLEYFCGQAGKFNTGIGFAKVEYVDVFPDSAILLVVNLVGEGYKEYRFFQGKTPCYFDEFYMKYDNYYGYKEKGSYTYSLYHLKHTRYPEYKATEITEYIHWENNRNTVCVDSATAKVINLWELAKQHRLANHEDRK